MFVRRARARERSQREHLGHHRDQRAQPRVAIVEIRGQAAALRGLDDLSRLHRADPQRDAQRLEELQLAFDDGLIRDRDLRRHAVRREPMNALGKPFAIEGARAAGLPANAIASVDRSTSVRAAASGKPRNIGCTRIVSCTCACSRGSRTPSLHIAPIIASIMKRRGSFGRSPPPIKSLMRRSAGGVTVRTAYIPRPAATSAGTKHRRMAARVGSSAGERRHEAPPNGGAGRIRAPANAGTKHRRMPARVGSSAGERRHEAPPNAGAGRIERRRTPARSTAEWRRGSD